MKNIFRAYDIRGVYQEELTLDFAEKIGLSFGTFLGNKGTVIMGRDARHGGPDLQAAVTKGLNRAGLNTVDIGMLPTPALNYYCARENATAGIIISASHNPPEYNGIRFRKGDGAGYPECIPEVKKTYFDQSWVEKGGGVHCTEDNATVIESYLGYITNLTEIKRPLKVVLDPGNGAASNLGTPLFEKLGCSVTSINDTPDGDFPGRGPHPKEDTLAGLQQAVLDQGADLGVAYDGDADRAVFVDDKGEVKLAEEVGVMIAKEILAEGKGEIALNVDCSMSMDEAAVEAGGTSRRIRVGDVFLANAVKEGAVFAMESSSHFVIPKYYGFDDGIATSAFVAQILSETDERFSDITARIPKYPVLRKTMEVSDDKKFQVIDSLAERFKEKDPLTIDGVKIDYPNGWTLVRASNTQPMLRLTAEGKTQEDVERLMGDLEKAVKEEL